jgi:O-antigen ligase
MNSDIIQGMGQKSKKLNQESENLPLKRSLFLASAVTLAITPTLNFDPINIVKSTLLLAMAGVLVPHFFTFFSRVQASQNSGNVEVQSLRLIKILLATAIVFTAISNGLSGSRFSQLLYGVHGRNTGFLSYLALIVILGAAIKISFSSGINQLLFKSFLVLSVVQVLYGTVQALGLDPINWNNQYNVVITTLGNPNFASAFMGMLFSGLFPYVIAQESHRKTRFAALLLCVSLTILIIRSDSQQGILLVIAGFFLSLIAFSRFKLRMRNAANLMGLSLITLAPFVVLGFLGRGFLGEYLKSQTFVIRFEYWRTAIAMAKDNLWFGVGSDSYGNVFRQYRDKQTLDLIGSQVFTNSAHNVFLDSLANNGLVVSLSFFILSLLTLFLAIRKIIKSDEFNPLFIGLLGFYLTYLLQSLVSINQLGIAVWGWLAQGVLIGWSISDQVRDKRPPVSAASVSLFSGLGLIVALAIALPNFATDSRFNSALRNGDVNQLVMAAKAQPLEPERMRFSVDLLEKQGFPKEADELSRFAIVEFPNSFILLAQRLALANPSEAEKAQILDRARALDPIGIK